MKEYAQYPKKDIRHSFPNLSEQREYLVGHGVATNLIALDKKTSKPITFAKVISNNDEVIYHFNPKKKEELETRFPQYENYPPSVPSERRLEGMQKLYWEYFAGELRTEDLARTNAGRIVPVQPERFASQKTFRRIDHPFEGMKGKTLVSFLASMRFHQAFTSTDLPEGHESLLSYIESEIAKDHRILGATQVSFDYEIQKGGENIKTKEEYILLIIEGLFTTGRRTSDQKRLFDSKLEVKIVARKIGSVTETDSDAIWLSALSDYLRRVYALKHPYRG